MALLVASDVALTTIICTYIFTFLAVLSLLVHGSVRLKKFSGFLLEDYLTFAAFMIALGLVGQITWAVIDEGQGQHMSDVSRSQFELTAKSLLANEALWALVNTFIRLSALTMFWKIFNATATARYFSAVLMCCSIMYGIAALLTAALICRPIQAAWDNQVQGTCGNQTAAYVALEVIGLVIDMAILALPFQPIMGLSMRSVTKSLILLAFSAGAFVIIITGFRIAALHRVNASDFTYDQGYLGLLSTLGALVSIICCCAVSFYTIGCHWYERLKGRNFGFFKISRCLTFLAQADFLPFTTSKSDSPDA
ncbi:hypothetical protein F4677DRAFT_49921 [Hypoxylon crocopeplum]|nr:hypothetical protein F4677DRAFT_49921 [Hypoxylon crocopeplum]